MIILYAIGLHATWGVMLLADATAAENRLVAGLVRDIGQTLTAAMLLAVSVLALTAFRLRAPRWRVGVLLPQQLMLFVVSGELAHLVWTGSHPVYGDQPRAVILMTTVAMVVLTVLHAAALVRPESK